MVGGVGLVLLLGLDVVFLLLLPQPPLGFLNFVWGLLFVLSLPPIGLLAYRTYGLAQAAYHLDSDQLVIEWGARREIIPLGAIREALPGRDIERDLRPGGLWWPGCIVGHGDDERLGRIEYLATAPQDQQVFVVTGGEAFALSPEALEEFVEAVRAGVGSERSEVGGQRLEAGGRPSAVSGQIPEGEAEVAGEGTGEGDGEARRESIRPAFEAWEVWHDRWAVGLLTAGALGAAALFAYIMLRLPSLPVTMPLHFTADGLGTPDRTGSPHGLLQLPLIGLLSLLVNGALGGVLHVRAGQRAAAYLLWGCAVFVQVLVWIATLGLMARA